MNLIHPISKKPYDIKNHQEFFDGVPDLFINDENPLSLIQSDFYNKIKFPNYNNIDDFGTLIDKSFKNLFIKKLDSELGFGSKILEAGCGTGQLSIALSRFQREIHSIDLSIGSLIEAKKFLEKSNINNVNLYRMNIFNLFFEKASFDVVISSGVLHHTHNCRLAFKKIADVLKPDGVIIIGLYHRYGRIIQKIRQMLFPLLGEKLKYFDKRFKENISDKKKYAWFLDQYNNAHESTHTYRELVDWFKEENISLLSSLPFDFKKDSNLFDKNKTREGLPLFLKELSLSFDKQQIYEGGFFVMIGKKNK